MADYYVQFSCLLDVRDPANHAAAVKIYEALQEDNEGSAGFSLAWDQARTSLHLHSDNGDVEQVLEFVMRCAEDFNLTGRWAVCFAHSCSKPRLDGFGGGAVVLDLGTGERVAWIDCETWAKEQLAAPAAAPAPPAATTPAPYPSPEAPADAVMLMSPNGTPIRGTLEHLEIAAHCTVFRSPDGEINIEHAGGSDVDWNGMRTVTRVDQHGNERAVLIDEDGLEWLESELIPIPEDDGSLGEQRT